MIQSRTIHRRNCEISLKTKITEKDSDTLAIYLLNFVKKYSFTDEVLNLFLYIIRTKKQNSFSWKNNQFWNHKTLFAKQASSY